MGLAHPCHTGRRPFMHSAGPYGPAGLLSPWTVRPLDVRNTLGGALSSARTALTRMFFELCTSHQVRSAPPRPRRSLPRPRSSASLPVVLHGGNERFVMLLCELLIELAYVRSITVSKIHRGVSPFGLRLLSCVSLRDRVANQVLYPIFHASHGRRF